MGCIGLGGKIAVDLGAGTRFIGTRNDHATLGVAFGNVDRVVTGQDGDSGRDRIDRVNIDGRGVRGGRGRIGVAGQIRPVDADGPLPLVSPPATVTVAV